MLVPKGQQGPMVEPWNVGLREAVADHDHAAVARTGRPPALPRFWSRQKPQDSAATPAASIQRPAMVEGIVIASECVTTVGSLRQRWSA